MKEPEEVKPRRWLPTVRRRGIDGFNPSVPSTTQRISQGVIRPVVFIAHVDLRIDENFGELCSAYLDGLRVRWPLGWELRRAQKHPLRGMLSLEEIRNWGDSVAAESTFKLIEFCHKPAKPAGRAVTRIVFGDGGNEYRVWIFRNTSFTLLAFTKVYRPIFSEDVTRRSLECISRILRRSLA